MRSYVTRNPERVYLELSPEEFAVIEHARFQTVSGRNPVRRALEDGFDAAVGGLSENTRERVEEARGMGVSATVTEIVRRFPAQTDPRDEVPVQRYWEANVTTFTPPASQTANLFLRTMPSESSPSEESR